MTPRADEKLSGEFYMQSKINYDFGMKVHFFQPQMPLENKEYLIQEILTKQSIFAKNMVYNLRMT